MRKFITGNTDDNGSTRVQPNQKAHVVLLGDMVLDNSRHVEHVSDTISEQLRQRLSPGSTVTMSTSSSYDSEALLQIVSGSVSAEVLENTIPTSATHVIISVGLVDMLELLEREATQPSSASELEQQVSAIQLRLSSILAYVKQRVPNTVLVVPYLPCEQRGGNAVYDRAAARYSGDGARDYAHLMQQVYGPVISYASQRGVAVVDLARTFGDGDEKLYASECTVSGLGATIVAAVMQVAMYHNPPPNSRFFFSNDRPADKQAQVHVNAQPNLQVPWRFISDPRAATHPVSQLPDKPRDPPRFKPNELLDVAMKIGPTTGTFTRIQGAFLTSLITTPLLFGLMRHFSKTRAEPPAEPRVLFTTSEVPATALRRRFDPSATSAVAAAAKAAVAQPSSTVEAAVAGVAAEQPIRRGILGTFARIAPVMLVAQTAQLAVPAIIMASLQRDEENPRYSANRDLTCSAIGGVMQGRILSLAIELSLVRKSALSRGDLFLCSMLETLKCGGFTALYFPSAMLCRMLLQPSPETDSTTMQVAKLAVCGATGAAVGTLAELPLRRLILGRSAAFANASPFTKLVMQASTVAPKLRLAINVPVYSLTYVLFNMWLQHRMPESGR